MKSVLEMAHRSTDSRADGTRINRPFRIFHDTLASQGIYRNGDRELGQLFSEFGIPVNDIVQQLRVRHVLLGGQDIQGFPQCTRACAKSLVIGPP